MRRKNTENIATVISRFLREAKIDRKINEQRLMAAWSKVVGKTVASRTTNLFIKNEILFVSIQSSIVRGELLMLKTTLIEQLNSAVGREVIKNIVVK